MSKPFEPTATWLLLNLYVKSMKESQVYVTICQPFTQKGTLLRMFKKLPPKKKLIFSCKARTTSSHNKGIMEETICLRISVTFYSHCSSLVPCSRLLPSLWWWLPAPCHSWYKEQDRCSLKCFASVQCPKPSESLTAAFSRWQKGLLIDTSVIELRVHGDKEWGGAVASAAADMNCHCPSVCQCLQDFCQETELILAFRSFYFIDFFCIWEVFK